MDRMLREHGLNSRSQRNRTNVPHSTVSGWLQDIPPSYLNALKFAQGFHTDPDELREALSEAGFEAPATGGPQPAQPEPAKAPDLKAFFANRQAQESPFDRLLRLYGELVKWCEAGGYQAPPLAAGFYGGIDSLTNERVDDYIEDLRDQAIRAGRK